MTRDSIFSYRCMQATTTTLLARVPKDFRKPWSIGTRNSMPTKLLSPLSFVRTKLFIGLTQYGRRRSFRALRAKSLLGKGLEAVRYSSSYLAILITSYSPRDSSTWPRYPGYDIGRDPDVSPLQNSRLRARWPLATFLSNKTLSVICTRISRNWCIVFGKTQHCPSRTFRRKIFMDLFKLWAYIFSSPVNDRRACVFAIKI